MKRCTILIAFSLCVVGLFAQQVTEEQALQKAQAFMQGKVKNSANGRRGASAKASVMHRVIQDVPTDAYYMFNVDQDDGYVIVSGDERTEEILGYSTEGHIDPQQMPENMRAWLKGYEEQIKAIPANATASASMPTHPAVEPLLTCQWGQSAPYNLQCPTQIPVGGTEPQHCVTGCAATAMAQIMYYWKWPQDYTTTIPAYDYGYERWDEENQTPIYKYHADELPPVKFDWANMKDTYYINERDASADAVAQLMHYCGQSIYMQYGVNSSSATCNEESFINFGYDSGAFSQSHDPYTIKEWDAMIYKEIEAGRPIMFSGQVLTGAHAFVCDGYDGNGGYHFNWGWSGDSNGYFKLNVHSSWDYLTSQNAIFGIQRPTGENDRVNVYGTHLGVDDRRNVDGKVYALCGYMNYDLKNGFFDGGFEIECINGTYTNTIHQLFNNKLIERGKKYGYGDVDLLSLNLPDGDYRFRLIMKPSSSSEWRYHASESQYLYKYIGFSITDGVISSLKTAPVVNVKGNIQAQGSLLAGYETRLDVSFINYGDEFNHRVYLYASQTEDMGKPVALNSLALEEGSEETITFDYRFEQEGLYHVWVAAEIFDYYDFDYHNVIIAETDLIISKPREISVLSKGINRETKTITINVQNYDEVAYDNDVAIRVYPLEDAKKRETFQIIGREKLHIEPGQNVDVSFVCPNLSIDIDNLYYAEFMYCINPNDNVLSDYYIGIPLSPSNEGYFAVNGITYSIVDTKNNYVFAYRCFNYDSSAQVTVPAKVISPRDGISYTVKGVCRSFCLNDTDINNLTFSDGITTMDEYAIESCEALETIVLPASLRRLGGPIIHRCQNLKTIYSKAYEPPLLVSYNGQPYVIGGEKQCYDEITLYVPKGSRDSYAKAWPQFTNIVEMDDDMPGEEEPGDLNGDGTVSITDVVLIIDVIAGTITDATSVKAADVNKDGNVTITDCVAAIDLIAANSTNVRMNRAPQKFVSSDYISASMEDRLLTVSLENENHYTAFQIVVTLPNGMTIDRAAIDNQRGSDHQLVVRNIGNGKYLVVGFSMDNNELMGNSGRLLNITTNGQAQGDIVISDIEFATAKAESFYLNPISISSGATGIHQIENNEREADGVIFDLQGRRVTHPSRGLYIVNGSKLIVK